MSIDKKTVTSIARLARLNIADDEVARYQTELSNILDLVEQMDACDTSDIKPMTHPFDASLRFREDVVSETNQRQKFQKIAPQASDGLYLVPKVID